MLRIIAGKLTKLQGIRPFVSTAVILEEEKEAPKIGKEAFLESWTKVAPVTLSPPEFIGDYIKKVEKTDEEKQKEKSGTMPSKVTLNFYMPSSILMEGEKVDLALLPAVTGDFGVMPGHVPTLAQLRPGVVSIHKEMDKDIKKYFVSGGFAFIHADSTADVCVIEAAELDKLDKDAVKAGLAEYTAKLGSLQGKGDDYEIAAAQIGVDVYSAMDAAVQ